MNCNCFRKNAVIIGGNHHNTLGVIRALGYKGIRSTVIIVTDEHKPYVSLSKFIKECFIIKTKQEIVPLLLKHNTEDDKSIIISCADFATSELDKAYDILKDKYYLPTASKPGICNFFMRKDEMASLANIVGLRTPKTMVVSNDEIYDIAEIAFPCIIKPLASIMGSKQDIVICNNNADLQLFLSRNTGRKFLIQEFVKKTFEYQLIGVSLNYGEEIIIPGYSKCIRPCPGTNTGFLEYKPLDDFDTDLVACQKFIKGIGYQGLFSLEFLRDSSGRDYFMEINMRNDGNGICVTGAGVNLPYIWYLYCSGLDYSAEKTRMVSDIYVMPEFDDFTLLLKNKVNVIKWLHDYRRTTTFMEYDKLDSAPYRFRKSQYIRHLLRCVLPCHKQ